MRTFDQKSTEECIGSVAMPVDRRLTKPVARDVAEQLRESFESGTYTSANGSTYTGTIDRDYQRMGCGEDRI